MIARRILGLGELLTYARRGSIVPVITRWLQLRAWSVASEMLASLPAETGEHPRLDDELQTSMYSHTRQSRIDTMASFRDAAFG